MIRKAWWVSLLGIFLAGMAFAHSVKVDDRVRSTAVTMVGEVVDPQCYFTHGARGADHIPCAQMCARGGQGLSFLEEKTGRVYALIASGHGRSQNEGVLEHVGKPVRVRGTVFAKGEDRVLLIQSISSIRAKNKGGMR